MKDQTRQEIIKIIKKYRPVFIKNDLKPLLTSHEVMRIREVLRIEILEELGEDCSEMRKKLNGDKK